MKQVKYLLGFLTVCSVIGFVGCSSDDDENATPGPTETGLSQTYTLEDVGQGISGTAVYTELSDNTTKVTIQLQNTPDGGSHPAHIHMNSAVEGGGVAISLAAVDGTTGMSESIISTNDNGDAVTYADLIAYDGHIMVHLSLDEMSTIVARGDVGGNALTETSETYTLEEVDGSGVSGTATFEERANGNTLVTIELNGTPAGGDHPAHIHMNDVATGGGVVLGFTNVNGDTGMSMTHVEEMNDETPVSYSELITYNGHIMVHLSPDDLATVVARGNIGSNTQ